MSGKVCTRARALSLFLPVLFAAGWPSRAFARETTPTFKVAFFNIQSGKGEPALPGHPYEFPDTTNCTDPSQPMNGWGTGFVQRHLIESVGADQQVVALGLAESWASVCGSPENVRKLLGWKARTSERNGVAMVARYGFVGGEEWVQLDTSLNSNPADTMWVLRMRVCLDAGCGTTINVFAAHWFGAGSSKNTSYDRQGRQTAEFLQRAGGTEPHLLIGDLNAFDGSAKVCDQWPNNAGLQPLRDAGYMDAWPLLHGSAEGFTGMTNRAGCGVPEGYGWKRPDYTWAPSHFLPVGMTRFGVVTAGDAAPSDHYGIITEFPWPVAAPPADIEGPAVRLVSPTATSVAEGTVVPIAIDAVDQSGVSKVEVIEDGVVIHTLDRAPYQMACASLAKAAGVHTLEARAFDGVGNVGMSPAVQITVEAAPPAASTSHDIVLYASHATAIAGRWELVADPTAAGGARMASPDAKLAKLGAPLASPADYFELTFHAEAGTGYRLWMRGRAERDFWGNDSAFFQFSGAVTATGVPVFRIGTTSATWLGVEDCSGCAIGGWGWNDNAYGAGLTGPLVYFETTGPQTLRIQRREDGLSIDQVVLSAERFLEVAPGAGTYDATILPVSSAAPAPAPSLAEIVITAASASTFGGTWRRLADDTAAEGVAVGNPDANAAKVGSALAAPANYVEFTFDAEAGREYRLWIRGRADRDHWANDSVFVQFSDAVTASGQATARIGTSSAFMINLEEDANRGLSGWGWQDNGYGAGVLGPLVSFPTTGTRTLRIQTREDGLRLDQIVLSSEQYLTVAPGALKNDETLLR
jgi:hypothetical protein